MSNPKSKPKSNPKSNPKLNLFNYNVFYNYYTDVSNLEIDNSLPRPIINFYHSDTKSKKPSTSTLSKYYIIIDNLKIYVSSYEPKTIDDDPNKRLLFTIPVIINNKIYDFHYYFGIKEPNENIIIHDWYFYDKSLHKVKNSIKSRNKHNKTKKKNKKRNSISNTISENNIDIDTVTINPNEKLIFFHKTIQIIHNTQSYIGTNQHTHCHFQDNISIDEINKIICLDETNKYMGKLYSENDLNQIEKIMKLPFQNQKTSK
jgi:hypothetical protein